MIQSFKAKKTLKILISCIWIETPLIIKTPMEENFMSYYSQKLFYLMNEGGMKSIYY